MLFRLPRRSLALGAGATLLATSALTSCGMDERTNKINQITAGTVDRDGRLDALNVMVVSAEPETGTLVGLLTSNSDDEELSLDSVEVKDAEVSDFEPLVVAPTGSAQLTEAGIRIDGDFVAGDFIEVTLGFSDGEQVLQVPVLPSCRHYEGFDDAPTPSASPAPGASESAAPEEGATETEEVEGSEDGLDTEGSGTAVYECEPPEAPEHEE